MEVQIQYASSDQFVAHIKEAFIERFDHVPIIFKSPGRINIIGEHTDYNQGFVMPAAIDKAVYVAVSRRADDHIVLYAANFEESFRTEISGLRRTEVTWANYILGVADQLQKWGYHIGGFNLYVDGDVPFGAGLSSSAAVECATAYALAELFTLSVPKVDLARIAQQAEHEFAGVKCGIMDQFASVFGRKGHALLLDCSNMDQTDIPLILEGYQFVLFNTNVKHSLASTAYNTRRAQCEKGVEWIQLHIPTVLSLRDVNVKMLNKYVKAKDDDVYQKCRYVVEENQRVLNAANQLKNGDIMGLGQAMFETHEGLSKAYEVSCEELDFLVNAVKDLTYVIGARMMGGGFGGCTLNIVEEGKINHLIEMLGEAYTEQFVRPLTAYVVKTGDGTSQVL